MGSFTRNGAHRAARPNTREAMRISMVTGSELT
jgi:hypothetical protein